MNDRFYVYILASQPNGTLYVGVTNDLSRRMTEHKSRLVPGFTRQYGVDKLVYFEGHTTILAAREREQRMKRWKRAWENGIDREARAFPIWIETSTVMAGLVPAIHAFLCSQGVDARHKAGHDEIEAAIQYKREML